MKIAPRLLRGTTGALSSLALLAGAAAPAQAAVLFTWQTSALGGNISSVEGRIAFSDSFFPAGQPTSTIGCNGSPYLLPTGPSPVGPGCVQFAGIQDFYFRVNGSAVPLSFDSIRMVSRLTLNTSGALVGSIRAQSATTTDVDLSSAAGGSLWTINQYASDAGPLACFTGPSYCFGATGSWVLSAVPEPASGWLLAAGGVVLGGLARRRLVRATRPV